jgi:hypothetical protein
VKQSIYPWLLGATLVGSACLGPTPQEEARQREVARQFAAATTTALAVPTLSALATSQAQATATAAQATAQSIASVTAVAQGTQQARDIEARVQAALAATQAAVPSATPVPPTETPVPATQTPVVIFVPQPAQPPVYVPVPVPAPTGNAPQYIIDAINECNNAYTNAKWSLSVSDLSGHMIGRELMRGQEYVRGLVTNRTRVASTFVSGYVTTWNLQTGTRAIATTNETWRFINYDADRYTLKRDLGVRLYRNVYTIEFTGFGWKVSLDDIPNPNGEAV